MIESGNELLRQNWQEHRFSTCRKLLQFIQSPEIETRQIYHNYTRYPYGILCFAAAVFLILSLAGVVGNVITIIAITKYNKIRYFVSTLIINLSILDLFISGCYAFMMFFLLTQTEGYYSERICRLFSYMKYAGSMISMLIIIAIVVNRCISVTLPGIYSAIYTKRNIYLMIAFIWLFPIFLFMLPYGGLWGDLNYDQHSGTCDIVGDKSLKTLAYIFLFQMSPIFIVCLYTIVFIMDVIRRERMRLKRNDDMQYSNKSSGATQEPSHEGKDIRVLFFVLLIFAITIICYIPHFYVKTVRKRENYHTLHLLSHVPYFFASAIKPVFYYAMSQDYREKYKNIFL